MIKQYKKIDFNSDESMSKAKFALHNKKSLYANYCDIYRQEIKLRNKYLVPHTDGGIEVELGSGGGFFKELYPQVITSDVSLVNGVDMLIDAQKLPFENDSIECIYMTHVLHHIPDVRKFLNEVMRCCKHGGGCCIVEPYWSPVAKFFFKRLHPEPFDDKTKEWEFISSGAMSGSNQALSYILLKRDRKILNKEYPDLSIEYDHPFNGLSYILTGGLWLKPMLPEWIIMGIKKIEKLFDLIGLGRIYGLHHIFVLKKK